jgi:hypothetical protein
VIYVYRLGLPAKESLDQLLFFQGTVTTDVEHMSALSRALVHRWESEAAPFVFGLGRVDLNQEGVCPSQAEMRLHPPAKVDLSRLTLEVPQLGRLDT